MTVPQRIPEDIEIAKRKLAALPIEWEGKKCVLELKDANYQWKQMEWWAFYFEWQCRRLLEGEFRIPGERIGGRVTFDAKRSMVWDFKAKAIKSDDHRAILNDMKAVDEVVGRDGAYGAIIGI